MRDPLCFRHRRRVLRKLRRGLLPGAVAGVLVALPAAGTGTVGSDPTDTALVAARAHRVAHEAEILRTAFELLAIPNVASDLPNIERNARWIADALTARGVETRLHTLDDDPAAPPIVLGLLDVPGVERRLGIYVHYDGQPVDPARWTTNPWIPELWTDAVENGGTRAELPAPGARVDPTWRILGRSASDDKAPIVALLAVLDAFAAADLRPTSDLVFFFEGEEEAGSTRLERHLGALRDELRVDAWLICDGPIHQTGAPQLVFGVRGYAGLDLTVYGARRTLHSGHYGNWAPNPAMRLARLLASMVDDEGDVVIEGFHDSNEPLGDAARAALAAVPDADEAIRRELGLAATDGGGAPLVERLLRPSFNVRGLQSASVGASARNLIPTEATASIDMRLVAGNDPEAMIDLVEAHVRARGYHVVREDPDPATRLEHPRIVRIDRRPGYRAARSDPDHPILGRVAAAVERADGRPPVLLPSLGGSLPLHLFVDLLDAPIVIFPIANHDNNQHGPNENLRLAELWSGIDRFAAVLAME